MRDPRLFKLSKVIALTAMIIGCSTGYDEPVVIRNDYSQSTNGSQTLSSKQFAIQSDKGIRYSWDLRVHDDSLARTKFIGYEFSRGELYTSDGRTIELVLDIGPDRRAKGVSTIREKLGDSGYDDRIQLNRSLDIPAVQDFVFVDSASVPFRGSSRRRLGIWQSVDETRLLYFSAGEGGNPAQQEFIATISWTPSVIAVGGLHHGQESLIVLISDPDESGNFEIVGLNWPRNPQ